MSIKFKVIGFGKLPEFKSEGADCLDCYARLDEKVVIKTGDRALIPLGFAVELPKGYEMQVRGRSGLAAKGIDVSFGTVDSDYRGEVMGCVINNSKNDFTVENGDRICQCAVRSVPKFTIDIVEELSKTERGEKGFGHTGVKE